LLNGYLGVSERVSGKVEGVCAGIRTLRVFAVERTSVQKLDQGRAGKEGSRLKVGTNSRVWKKRNRAFKKKGRGELPQGG